MKKIVICGFAVVVAASVYAQNIKLPAPQTSGGKPLMEAIALRQSARSYDTKAISEQQLSNILWAAYGFNRPEKRTVPSANNKQAFEVYVAMESGMYLYDAAANTLELKVAKDLREATGRQPFVKAAPVNLVYVYDTTRQPNENMAYADCGFIAQNVYLVCAAEGLATVVRGMVGGALREEMSLPADKKVVMAQTIGYAAE